MALAIAREYSGRRGAHPPGPDGRGSSQLRAEEGTDASLSTQAASHSARRLGVSRPCLPKITMAPCLLFPASSGSSVLPRASSSSPGGVRRRAGTDAGHSRGSALAWPTGAMSSACNLGVLTRAWRGGQSHRGSGSQQHSVTFASAASRWASRRDPSDPRAIGSPRPLRHLSSPANLGREKTPNLNPRGRARKQRLIRQRLIRQRLVCRYRQVSLGVTNGADAVF